MSSSLLRSVVRHRQNLIPSLRSVSSNSSFDYKSIFSSDPLTSLQLTPDDTLQVSDSVSAIPYFSHKKYPFTDDNVLRAVREANAFVELLIQCENNTGIVYKALHIINHHSIFSGCDIDIRLEILSAVFDRIRNCSIVNDYEVFLMNIFIKSMTNEGSKKNMTMDEVIVGVLNLIQSYPKTGRYRVTEETHLSEHLGFSDIDFDRVQKALYLEFRLYVPMIWVKAGCKQIIDFIYHNPKRRLDFISFQTGAMCGDVFWARPLIPFY